MSRRKFRAADRRLQPDLDSFHGLTRLIRDQAADPRVDQAIAAYPKLREFVRQGLNQPVSRGDALKQLSEITGEPLTAKPEVARG